MEATLERPKHVLSIMKERPANGGEYGDTKTMWDPHNDAEVAAARKVFNDLRKAGHLIYRVVGEDARKGSVMHEFDPDAAKLIAVPREVGG